MRAYDDFPPVSKAYLDLGVWHYAKYILSAGAPVLLCAACLAATVYFLPMPPEGGFISLAIRGALAAGPAFAWILWSAKKGL